MNKQQCTVCSYHLPSQSTAAPWSWRCPAPCPALAKVAITTISSGKPVPSPLASISVAIGIRVLSRTVHTPSPTWLMKKVKISDAAHHLQEGQLRPTLQEHGPSNALVGNSCAQSSYLKSDKRKQSVTQLIYTARDCNKSTVHKIMTKAVLHLFSRTM